jgi:alpha-acetolactate decarboxylase
MQLSRQAIAGQQFHALSDPGIVVGAIAPEVLMGVDAEGFHGGLGREEENEASASLVSSG